jgi:hypothetical protein
MGADPIRPGSVVWFCHLAAEKVRKWRRAVVVGDCSIAGQQMIWIVYGTKDPLGDPKKCVTIEQNTAAHTMMALTEPKTFFYGRETYLVHSGDLVSVKGSKWCPTEKLAELVALARSNVIGRKVLARQKGECGPSPS